MSLTPTPRPLFKEQMAGHVGGASSTTSRSYWQRLTGSNGQVGSPDTPVGPLAHSQGPGAPQQLYFFECLGAGSKLSPKDVQKYFSKNFDAQNIFRIFKGEKC